ncbi:MAG TPA: HNH endonuclease [Candidatus Paceibacterota bacterium]|nr:HNH endonuclease [Candidatus Paceibacterota bacterium]
MSQIQDQILSYREMCNAEDSSLQRGMNFRLNPLYSVILMSQRSNAPYQDKIWEDGITIEYEGHDVTQTSYDHDPKNDDQLEFLPSGKPTQNGKFIEAVKRFKSGETQPEPVKVYEKIVDGTWSLKGYFDLIDYKVVFDGKRNVFRFILKLSAREENNIKNGPIDLKHTRLIPSSIKREVWKRDQGKCVLCGATKNLHYDHELPYSEGGTSLLASNIRILCATHNLQKSNKIE